MKINNKLKYNTPALEDDVVLRVEHLSKKFCRTLKRSMFYGTIDIARSMTGINYDTSKLRKDEFWALDDVSFELKKGETLGIIGENGSGKSTLLRLITGIFPPDKGRILFKGRIGALIAVGAGFHPHMTGRENIYLNGTILGMTRKELDERLNEIIHFTELGESLDAPVSTYSSGMRVRLGFSIAVHCEPDILLVDEILSVGDLSFRNKSLRKMNEFSQKAKGLIFISHNLEQIRVLCSRVIVMEHGEIIFIGDTDEGIIKYENISKDSRLRTERNNSTIGLSCRNRQVDGDRVIVKQIGLINESHQIISSLRINEPLILFLNFKLNEFISEAYFVFFITNEKKDTNCIYVKSNDTNQFKFKNITPGDYSVKLKISEHHLGPGIYFINYAIRNNQTDERYDRSLTDLSFCVKSDSHFERGIILAEHEWHLDKLELLYMNRDDNEAS